MLWRDLMEQSTTLQARAKGADLVQYLLSANGELIPEYQELGINPVTIVHDVLDPNTLDPSEWDDWSEPPLADSKPKIAGLVEAYRRGDKVPPVLVHGTPQGSYMPQVVEGHHRTAAAIIAGVKIPVVYTLDTLIGLWKRANQDPNPVRVLRKQFIEQLKANKTQPQ